jgi:CheY-like chemotaxis protein
MQGDCGAYIAAGMDAYVSKPIRGRELYAALAPFLGGAKEGPSSGWSKASRARRLPV